MCYPPRYPDPERSSSLRSQSQWISNTEDHSVAHEADIPTAATHVFQQFDLRCQSFQSLVVLTLQVIRKPMSARREVVAMRMQRC